MRRAIYWVAALASLSIRIDSAVLDDSLPDMRSRAPIVSRFPFSLFKDYRDLRGHFFGPMAIQDAIQRGRFFLIDSGFVDKDGRLQNLLEVALTECPTVEEALRRKTKEGPDTRRQIRVIQRHALIQTPIPRDREAKKVILATKLNAGDVVIVATEE